MPEPQPSGIPAPEPPANDAASPQNKRAKAVVRFGGSLLVVVSLAFVAQRLSQHLGVFAEHFEEVSIALMAGGLLAFTTSQLLLSSAWYLLLRWQGARSIRAADCHVLCGRAQISKYIPGNVFQYVARHLAFRRLGVSDGSLMLAVAYETLSFVIAAGLLVALGLPFFARQSSVISPPLAALAGLVAIVVLAGIVRFGRPLLKLVGRAPPEGSDLRVTQVLSVVPLYAAFLSLSGCLALALHRSAGGDGTLGLAVIPAYSLAWLCGYIVPGASGGFGIREATLLVLLGDNPQGLFVAIGMRIITTLGDVLWFAVSSLVARFQHAEG
ncbi:MAG TPA: hypothetical protein VI197_23990 [Polyangiaceae bacterium]